MTDGAAAAYEVEKTGNTRTDVLLPASATLVSQALMVISSILIARMLGPEGRGQMAAIAVAAVISARLLLAGTWVSIPRLTATTRRPAREAIIGNRTLLASAIGGTAVLTGVASVVWLRGYGDLAILGVAAAAWAAFLATQFTVAAMVQGEGNARILATYNLSGTIAYVGSVVIVFILWPSISAPLLLLALIPLRSLAIFWRGWRQLRKPDPAATERVEANQLRTFARRAHLGAIAPLTLGLDQVVVGSIVGTTALGYYAVAVTLTNLPVMVLAPLAPLALARIAAAPPLERRKVARGWVWWAAGVVLVLCAGLELVIGPVIRIALGEEFVPAITCARIMIVAWGFLAMRLLLSSMLQGAGRPGRVSAAESMTAVLMVGLVSLGCSRWGIEGAAGALVISGLFANLALLASARPRRKVSPGQR